MSRKPTAEIVENADHAGQKTRGGTSATPSPTTTTPGVTNTYDAFNRLTVVKDGVGTKAYAYDANSRLTNFDGPWADNTITCASDALGRRTNLLVQSSQPTGYEYHALALGRFIPTRRPLEAANRLQERTRLQRGGQLCGQIPLALGSGTSKMAAMLNRMP